MIKDFKPILLFICSVSLATFIWEFINFPFDEASLLKKYDNIENLHNPINDVVRFILYLAFPFIILIFYYQKKGKLFLKNLKIKTHNLDSYIEKTQIKKNIVFTGFRNSELEQYLERNKIGVKNSINSDTFLLITKDNSSKSSKIQEAEKKNIPIVTIDSFLKNKNKYIKK